jgi:hypothetical protein
MSNFIRKFAVAFVAMLTISSQCALADYAADKAALESQRQQIENDDKDALEAHRIAVEAEAKMNGEKPSSTVDGGTLLKGGVTVCVPKGTPIKLKISQVPTNGMKMLDRDFDGNLHPAQQGQEITAKTTEDIYVEDNKVIPAGTIFHGHVSKVIPPKRVGRPGSLVMSFDNFKTPDGRKFAFRAEANNKRESTNKSKAKGFGIIMAHAAGGAVVGAMIAYQIFGISQTIAMHGYNIAGAAAAGALMGTAVAVMRHGSAAVLEPGDDLNMEIDSDMLLPAATAPTPKAPDLNIPGMDITVLKTKCVKDGLDGHQMRVELLINNRTKRRVKSIDLFLEDDNGARYGVVGDADADATAILFDVDPNSSKHVMCNFQYEFPKLKGKIVWVDRSTRQPLYSTKLP